MIRSLVIVAGLLIGLALALALEGRVAQLTLLPEAWRPELPAGLDPDSGLTAGKIRLDLAPGLPAEMEWRMRGLDRDGLALTLHITGPGIDLAGPAHLGLANGGSLRIEAAAGTVELGAGAGDLAVLALRGRVDVTGLAASYAVNARQLRLAHGHAVWLDAVADGAPLGRVEVTLSEAESGSWLATISADGPALALQAEAHGSGAGIATVDGTLTAGPKMPPGWARWADQNLTRTETGWALAREIELGDLLAAPGAPTSP